MKSTKVALCQIKPEFDTDNSVKNALEMIKKAADNGAQLISLPEMFYYPYDLNKIPQIIGKEEKYLDLLRNIAKNKSVYLCTGSMAFKKEDGKIYNTSHLIGPDGTILGEYSKCHLYDANINGAAIRESSVFSPGKKITVIPTEIGRLGILICYDIRFPEFTLLYSKAGVDILLVPAVFNVITGQAHWNVMMRTRAIENQLFLLAISQANNSKASYSSYGHSLAINPWGEIMCESNDKEEISFCILDPEKLEESRKMLPLLKHRRNDIYNITYLQEKEKK
jgi:predicted amidohydrolase